MSESFNSPDLFGSKRAASFEIRRARKLPFRDEIRYWVVPWKHNEDSAERAARAALAQASPDGVIITDGNLYHPMHSLQFLENLYPEVTIRLKEDFSGNNALPTPETNRKALLKLYSGRSIFVVSPVKGYVPDWMLTEADFAQEGVLYRVVFREP